LELIGLDHPLVQEILDRYKRVPAEAIGVAVQADHTPDAVVSLWFVESHGKAGERKGHVQAVAVDPTGQRLPQPAPPPLGTCRQEALSLRIG